MGVEFFLRLAQEALPQNTWNSFLKKTISGGILLVSTWPLLLASRSSATELILTTPNFFVALYWAEELAAKDAAWAPLAQALKDNEAAIQQELIDIQGVSADVGGYYKLDEEKANAVMRPSKKFNELIDNY